MTNNKSAAETTMTKGAGMANVPGMTTVQGEPLSAESLRMLEYLSGRAAGLSPAEIRGRVRAAMAELDLALDGVDEAGARAPAIAGEWSIAQVVDHVAQTQIRAADELRHLLAGRRPPAPPVYEALASGAAMWAPWPELLDGLRSANDEMTALLDTTTGAGAPSPSARARTVLLANRAAADGSVAPEMFVAELDWREYALVQRLHLLDHRSQIKKLRAALAGRAAAAQPPASARANPG
jgi:hypothetical protein